MMSRAMQSSLRVLIVDDYRDAATTLACIVESWGYPVLVAFDAASALRQAEQFRPDAVLLDIGMPSMDGWKMAVELRKQFPRALLLVISGYAREEDRSHSRDAGCDYHFVKPMELDELERLLTEWQEKSLQLH